MGFAKKEIESVRMTAARPTLPEPEPELMVWDGQEERKKIGRPGWFPKCFRLHWSPGNTRHMRAILFSAHSRSCPYLSFAPFGHPRQAKCIFEKQFLFFALRCSIQREITEPPKLRTSTQSRCITYITIVKKRRERKKKSKKEKRVNKKSKRKSKCSMCRESK